MKPSEPWLKSIDAVEPQSFADYLSAHGWKRARSAMPRVETWVQGRLGSSSAISLLLPLDRDVVDYEPLIQRALRVVADSEERRPEDVLVEIRSPTTGILRVALNLPEDSAPGIPVEFADAMVSSLLQLTAAAADETAQGSNQPREWRDRAVESYLRRVRFEHTEPGNFAMRALLPQNLELPGVGSVLDTIERDIAQLETYAYDETDIGAAGHEVERWRFGAEAVRNLGRLAGPQVAGASIEISTPGARGNKEPHAAVWLDGRSLSRLSDIARWLTTEEDREAALSVSTAGRLPPVEPDVIAPFVLVGVVTALERPKIKVDGLVLGVRRRVTIRPVADDFYELAAEAHLHGREVRATGTLVLRQTSARMTELEEFAIST